MKAPAIPAISDFFQQAGRALGGSAPRKCGAVPRGSGMDDDHKSVVLPPQPRHLPTTRTPSVPDLPSSAGGIAFTLRRRQEMDARFSRALADNFRARADAYKAAAEYSNARFDFAVTLARWNTLDAVIEHEERKAFFTRSSELAVLALELETKEINARIARDQAMLVLQTYQPQPPSETAPTAQSTPTPTHPASTGLDPREVQAVLERFPDINPESIEPIIMMLRGVLAEKKA